MDIQKIKKNEKLMQAVRFGINGALAASVHYGVYALLQIWIDVTIAYIIGYIVSFIENFFLTSYFTFRTRPTLMKFIGFSGSHIVNFCLHVVLFRLFLWFGIDKLIAPPLVMMVAMVVQFTILRFVFTKKK